MQPPSGGCVLKRYSRRSNFLIGLQPPSGGCVLKHLISIKTKGAHLAAAFGRLCVETD